VTEISFVFVDGKKAKFRTMAVRSDLVEYLTDVDANSEFFSFYQEDGTLTWVAFDQIRHFSVKEIAVV
jgi:hypothetical protein